MIVILVAAIALPSIANDSNEAPQGQQCVDILVVMSGTA